MQLHEVLELLGDERPFGAESTSGEGEDSLMFLGGPRASNDTRCAEEEKGAPNCQNEIPD
jgi:hypothetical protein